jgi:hypothetical protein
MKTFIAAFALLAALPAAAQAQSAPAQDHSDHKGDAHKDCCKHKNADGSPMDCCKEKDGKRPACCQDQQGQDKHSGHEMSH